MVDAASGIMSIAPSHDRPSYESTRRRLVWPNGAVASFSADEPDRLRGQNFDAAWADELASWRYADVAWSTP
jgi:phage terminase large subunit-like protein